MTSADESQINSLLQLPLLKLISLANEIRATEAGSKLELCSIINAKSGKCPEDCKFCAQSMRHSTNITTYPLKEKNEIVQAAKQARDIGAERFCIVTSGKYLSQSELKKVAGAASEIIDKIDIKVCASLGKMNKDRLLLLKKAGVSRYHHNIETSPDYYPKIITTYSFQERIETIRLTKEVGLESCSGGIIGMGESMQDRIKMALILKDMQVDSVNINILIPIKGTPLENQPILSCLEAIRTIALFRIILRDKIIRLAAGRESILKDFQAMAFMAGANAMIVGGYLTIKGRDVESDWKLINEIKELWKN